MLPYNLFLKISQSVYDENMFETLREFYIFINTPPSHVLISFDRNLHIEGRVRTFWIDLLMIDNSPRDTVTLHS